MDLDRKEPGKKRVAWKLDVAEAYRILPMYPLWQIKQVNTIDGEQSIDRCNTFGGSSSGVIYISFNSLVAWIAKSKKKVKYVLNYVNNSQVVGWKAIWSTTHRTKNITLETKPPFWSCGTNWRYRTRKRNKFLGCH